MWKILEVFKKMTASRTCSLWGEKNCEMISVLESSSWFLSQKNYNVFFYDATLVGDVEIPGILREENGCFDDLMIIEDLLVWGEKDVHVINVAGVNFPARRPELLCNFPRKRYHEQEISSWRENGCCLYNRRPCSLRECSSFFLMRWQRGVGNTDKAHGRKFVTKHRSRGSVQLHRPQVNQETLQKGNQAARTQAQPS